LNSIQRLSKAAHALISGRVKGLLTGLWRTVPKRRRPVLAAAALCIAALAWLIMPPGAPFPGDYSRVVYDRNNVLLRATLAQDQQIRFPPVSDSLPAKYVRAVVACEDRRFFTHPGVDLPAVVKSAWINLSRGRQIRGASTITMQVARLMRRRPRTLFNKIIESAIAVRLTLHINKRSILKLYAAHVPMGGNTVGVETASWRYFGKPLREITWAEAALFAVLPNAPSLINIEKGRARLKARRDRALHTLLRRGIIDSISCILGCEEPLPDAGASLPFELPHLTTRALSATNAGVVRTTVDLALQRRIEDIVRVHARYNRSLGIKNLSVLIVNTKEATVAAYFGSQDFFDSSSLGQVDGIMARRSTGSLLKPFLTAKALDRGPYVMESKLHDVPTFYGSFCPQNASKEYAGLVTMDQMLVRSLNVPAVRLLYWYGVSDFYADLKKAHLSWLFRTPDGYGLTLILGGAEASLWDLTNLFAGLGNLGLLHQIQLLADTVSLQRAKSDTTRFCSEAAAWLVLNTLNNVMRPGSEFYWRFFANQTPVAWKTGTSYGQKDAWAIGTNARFTVGVWTGNFDGEGNASLGGAQSAGPVLFEICNALSGKAPDQWFTKPEHDIRRVTVCRASGLSPSPFCIDTITADQPACAYQSAVCPFHQRFLVDRKKGHTVCSQCWGGADTAWVVRTIYPPSVRSILKQHGFALDSLVRHNPRCPVPHTQKTIELVYPVKDVSIIVPRNLKGEYEKIVFQAQYQGGGARLFWYLDGSFLAETLENHSVAVDLAGGKHRLVVQDEEGSTASVRFSSFRK